MPIMRGVSTTAQVSPATLDKILVQLFTRKAIGSETDLGI